MLICLQPWMISSTFCHLLVVFQLFAVWASRGRHGVELFLETIDIVRSLLFIL